MMARPWSQQHVVCGSDVGDGAKMSSPEGQMSLSRVGESPPPSDQGGVTAGDLAPAWACCTHGKSSGSL